MQPTLYIILDSWYDAAKTVTAIIPLWHPDCVQHVCISDWPVICELIYFKFCPTSRPLSDQTQLYLVMSLLKIFVILYFWCFMDFCCSKMHFISIKLTGSFQVTLNITCQVKYLLFSVICNNMSVFTHQTIYSKAWANDHLAKTITCLNRPPSLSPLIFSSDFLYYKTTRPMWITTTVFRTTTYQGYR